MAASGSSSPLPYRVAPDDLRRYVAALARGRSQAQIRELGFSTKSFEGAAAAVEALGLASDRGGVLTALGRRLALAGDEDAPEIVRAVVDAFPAYEQLLRAVQDGHAPRPTPLHWIETWWATHGYGSSESNRAEAAPTFARLVEAAGLASYVQGRRGRASRIQWADGPAAAREPRVAEPVEPRAVPGPEGRGSEPVSPRGERERGVRLAEPKAGARPAPGPPSAIPPAEPQSNLIRWEFAPGRLVELRVPADLGADERGRLRAILDLLLRE